LKKLVSVHPKMKSFLLPIILIYWDRRN